MIEYITYKNNKYPIRISYRAMRGFEEETGLSFDDMQEENKLEHYEPLLYHSMLAGAKATETEMVVERGDIIDVLDECFLEFIELIPKFFPEADQGKVPVNRAERRRVEKLKKKQQKRK